MSIFTKEQVKELIQQKGIESVDDITATVKDLFKDMLQEVLEAELETHLGYDKYALADKKTDNTRNGYSKKAVKTQFGEVGIAVPRDRKGEFKPQIVPKHQRDISGLEAKIIGLYSTGLSTRDITEQIKHLYDLDISAEMVSNITNRIIPQIKEWNNRPLEALYSFIFMDAIHFKVREDHRIVSKAAYIVLGVDQEGFKDVLGIWIGHNETSKFWLGILNDLKNRGVQEVMIFSVDGLSGFPQAIEVTFPKAEIQRCIVHQIRNTLKYVSYKDRKSFAKDLKKIYTAPNEESALEGLLEVKETWGKSYPFALNSWEDHWDQLSAFYKYPDEVRRIIYATNIIEGLNRQYRKITKSKGSFPNDQALEKLLYLATMKICERWTHRYRNWDIVLNQLLILYGEEFGKDTVYRLLNNASM